jgi:hypothetical protein
MAAPTLSKSGVTTVTFSKASVFPGSSPRTINQFTGISDDNTIRVASLGPAKQSFEVVFEQLTSADITAVTAFFENPLVNWGVNEFTWTDEDGVATGVRFLQTEFDPREDSEDNWTLALVFTVA